MRIHLRAVELGTNRKDAVIRVRTGVGDGYNSKLAKYWSNRSSSLGNALR